ncbi:putative sulfate exporter family transporter [Nonomuraea sp. B12E4]|uniref:YeiH family protein n=1 Tax=Nonomuraea sp. B12E4 TaxID=3153564 RepID=UPI00325F2539
MPAPDHPTPPSPRPSTPHSTPTPPPPTAAPALPAAPTPPHPTGARPGRLWPGFALAAVAVAVASLISGFVPALSPAVIAVFSGAALANTAGLGERFKPGLAFVARRVLRVAVALLGLQIAIPQVLALGWQTLAIVAVATTATFTLTPRIGRRLGLPPGTSLLIATGVSICGAAAIAAMRDSTDLADDDDTAGALSVIVLYGTAAIVLVPLAGPLLGLTSAQLGVWTGASVHEVAQVAAIGTATGVLTSAVTVKLGRVVLLAPIVALTTHRQRQRHRQRHRPARPQPATAHQPTNTTPTSPPTSPPTPRPGTRPTLIPPAGLQRRATPSAGTRHTATPQPSTRHAARPPIIPLFVAAFLALVALRSTGWLPPAVTTAAPIATNVLMAAALFALGTGINLRKLAKGGRAILLGGIATGIIAALSLAGVTLLV